MALNKWTCGECHALLEDCKCVHKKEKKEVDGLKAQGYQLDESDIREVF